MPSRRAVFLYSSLMSCGLKAVTGHHENRFENEIILLGLTLATFFCNVAS